MAQYQITDPKSGKTVTVEGGDTPPTQQDAEGIFAQAGLRGGTNSQPQQQSNPIMDFLASASKPFRQAGQGIMDLGEAAGYGVDKYLLHDPQADQNILNAPHPFLNNQENQQALDHPVKTGAEIAAGLGSYAVPFGKGANLLTKVIAPGAVSGGLQAASEDIANPGKIIQGAIGGVEGAGVMHGAGTLVNKVASPVINKVGDMLEKGGNSVISSQYQKAGSAAADNNINDAVAKLKRYGISNIDDVVQQSQKVTGADGILNKMVRTAIAKVPSVDVGGIIDKAKEALNAGDNINVNQGDKFMTRLNKALFSNASETSPGNGDPLKTFDFIRGLEADAHALSSHRNASTGDMQMARVYNTVADELKNRLYNGVDSEGNTIVKNAANNMIHQPTDEEFNTLHAIHPQLAQDVVSAPNVKALRSLQQPFVAASKTANVVERKAGGKMLSPTDILSTAFTGGAAIPWLVAYHALNSNTGKTIAGNTMSAIGEHMHAPEVGAKLQALLDLIGAKTGSAISQSPTTR